jgi:5'-nucleotidase
MRSLKRAKPKTWLGPVLVEDPMRRTPTCFLRAIVCLCATLAVLLGTPAAAFAEQAQVHVLAITDFHGHIENGARLAGTIDQERAAYGASTTTLVSAGDNINASYFASSIQRDTPAMDQLKAMGLTVSATGNHEFDNGIADLYDRVIPCFSPVQYVAANLNGVDTSKIPAYTAQVISGKTVAFVGATLESLPSAVNPSLLGGITTSSIVKSVDYYARQLKDGDPSNGEADAVVVLAHEGTDALKGLSPDVDAVVAGHTHVQAESATDAGAPIVQADHYGLALATIDLSWDDSANLTVGAKVDQVAKDAPEDATAKGIADAAEAKAKEVGGEQVGTILPNALGDTTLARATGNPSLNQTVSAGNQENRGSESTLGTLVATATLDATNDKMGANTADIGVVNSGGLRNELDPNGDGVITYMEAHDVLPFGNANALVTLTGAQLKELLNQQWQPGNKRPVLWLGLSDNVTYAYRLVTDENSNLRGEVFSVQVNGREVDDNATYRVAGNSFLLSGGDNFTVFKQGKDYIETGYIDLDATVSWLQSHAGKVMPAVRRHSVGFANLQKTGNHVSFDVCGLSFTAGETRPTYAHVAVNGIDFGYWPISDTGAVTDANGIMLTPYAGQTHVEMDLTDEQAAAFGDSINQIQLLASDDVHLEDSGATYVNFDTMPRPSTPSTGEGEKPSGGEEEASPTPAPLPDEPPVQASAKPAPRVPNAERIPDTSDASPTGWAELFAAGGVLVAIGIFTRRKAK